MLIWLIRGASATAATMQGMSVSEIMKVADWTSDSTFKTYYYQSLCQRSKTWTSLADPGSTSRATFQFMKFLPFLSIFSYLSYLGHPSLLGLQTKTRRKSNSSTFLSFKPHCLEMSSGWIMGIGPREPKHATFCARHFFERLQMACTKTFTVELTDVSLVCEGWACQTTDGILDLRLLWASSLKKWSLLPLAWRKGEVCMISFTPEEKAQVASVNGVRATAGLDAEARRAWSAQPCSAARLFGWQSRRLKPQKLILKAALAFHVI